MTTLFNLIALGSLMAAIPLQGVSNVPKLNEKPVQVVIEFFPNYTGHLLGVAQVGYNSSYAVTYKNTVLPDDLKYLKAHASLLKDEKGNDGILGYYLITFPCYVNPASKSDMAEYLHDLNAAVANRSFVEFEQKYLYFLRELERWNGFSVNTRIYDYEEEIQAISKIMLNNYDRFREDVWPLEYERMQRLADAMNEKFNEWDLISCWEQCTGLAFNSNHFRIVLSTGMASGPSSHTLGYEKEWCYYGDNPRLMIRNICQEAGFRMLADLCPARYGEYDPMLCYQVYEVMSEYFAKKILQKAGLKDTPTLTSFKTRELFSIFDTILALNPEMPAAELYDLSLQTLQRSKYAYR